jgi:hypothetical protein
MATKTVQMGWRVLIPDEYGGEPRVVYEGPSRDEAKKARRRDGAPRATFVRVTLKP